MDLNPYVFSIDMPRSNLCFKLSFFLFKKRHTISDSWINICYAIIVVGSVFHIYAFELAWRGNEAANCKIYLFKNDLITMDNRQEE
jgi:hypothetical protein